MKCRTAVARIVRPRSTAPIRLVATSASPLSTPKPPLPAEAHAAPTPISLQQLVLSSLSLSPVPPSALAALNARLSLHLPLPLVELALIHPSFWSFSPPDVHDGFTNFHDDLRANNGPLSTLGNSLLGAMATELLLAKFPNLPTRVAKAALTLYVGPKSLAAVASSWGIAPSRLEAQLLRDSSEVEERRLSRKDRAYGHLEGGVGGARKKKNSAVEGAAGGGLLRWNRTPTTPKDDAVLYEDAMASAARAVVGAYFRTHGFAKTRTFIHHHFLPRLISPTPHPSPSSISDLAPLLKFTSPTLVLSSLLSTHSLPSPVHRLLHESGRLSAHPTFVSGVFSGDKKLGEGFGSSIKMSEWRAGEDALRRYYLAGPAGQENGGLPSDAWCADPAKKGQFKGINVGATEVFEESAGR